MSFQPPDEGVFTAEEIQCLEEDAILLPLPPHSQAPGKRKVSATLVSSPSTITSSSPSSSSSASFRTWNFQPSTIFMDIPIEDEGAAVLEYLGFETSTASQIFERYAGRPDPDQCPDDLLDYAYGHIGILRTDRYREMDIKEAMTRVGLTQQIRSAIADPTFSDILWTRDLHFWVKDTIDTNYATLRSRQALLKRYAGRLIEHKKKRAKRSSVHGVFRSGGEGSASEAPEPGVTATINMTTQDFQLPAAHVALSEGDISTRPDHVLLYEGKAYWDMHGSQQLIRADGSVDMSTLATPPGGDFNSTFNAHYWTPEKEIAERYREWASRRCPGSDTCVIQVQVAKTFVERLLSAEMWFSPNWKEFVWICKRQQNLASKFHYTRDVDLIKGHICTGVSRAIARIAPADVQTQISRDQVMLRPSTNRPAIQWMFGRPQTISLLEDEVRGKIHVDIFAAAV